MIHKKTASSLKYHRTIFVCCHQVMHLPVVSGSQDFNKAFLIGSSSLDRNNSVNLSLREEIITVDRMQFRLDVQYAMNVWPWGRRGFLWHRGRLGFSSSWRWASQIYRSAHTSDPQLGPVTWQYNAVWSQQTECVVKDRMEPNGEKIWGK